MRSAHICEFWDKLTIFNIRRSIMAQSKHLELLAQNINNTLLARQVIAEEFLLKLQEEIFAGIEVAVRKAVGTAPTGAKKLIIRISHFNTQISEEDYDQTIVNLTCESYFSNDDITLKDNVVLGIEKTYTFKLFTRIVTMYDSTSNMTEDAKPEEIEYFRFYPENFYVDIRPTEIFPDGFMWAIPLEI